MIDFEVKAGRVSGARIGIAPGFDSPVEAGFLSVDEDAFFAVEAILEAFLRPDEQVDRYGVSIVAADIWGAASEEFLAQARRLRAFTDGGSRDAEEATKLDVTPPDGRLVQLVRSAGPDAAQSLAGLLETLGAEGRAWAASYPKVYVFGV